MKTKTKIPHLILACLFGATFASQGAVVALELEDANYARLLDTNSTFDGVGNITADHLVQVGTKQSGAGHAVNGGYAFQMTGSSSIYLDAVDFSVSYDSKQLSPTWNVDVYATRVSSDSTFSASDYENGTLLMEDFVTTTSTFGSKSLDATGQANLFTYLQNNWVEDDYIFITLKADPVVLTNNDLNETYTFSSGAPTWEAGKSNALLIISVPEPSSTALLGLGLSSMLLRRRRS